MEGGNFFDPANFDPSALMKLLQQAQKMSKTIATSDISISGVITNDENVAKAFDLAKKELQTKIPYNVENSYDCAWLRDNVLAKIATAEEQKKETITLENRCCTKDDCPQMMFMQLFVSHLK